MNQQKFLKFLHAYMYTSPTMEPLPKEIIDDRYERTKELYQLLISGRAINMNEFGREWNVISMYITQEQEWDIANKVINNINWDSSRGITLAFNLLINAILQRQFNIARRIANHFRDSEILRTIFLLFSSNYSIGDNVTLLDKADRVVDFLEETHILFHPAEILQSLKEVNLSELDLDPYLGLIILQQIHAQPLIYTSRWIQRIRQHLLEREYSQTASVLQTLETNIKG